MRGRRPRVGHADDDVGLDRRLAASRSPIRRAHLVQAAPAHDRVGPGEVDVLEDAQRSPAGRRRACGSGRRARRSTTISPGSISRSKRRADQVERARLGGEHPAVVEAADDQRADAVGVAEAGQRALGHDDRGERALDPAHRVGDGLAEVAGVVLGDQRRHHLGVGRRAQSTPAAPAAPSRSSAVLVRLPLWPSATVRPAGVADDRLGVLPHGRAGGRVAGVADRDVPLEARRAAPRRTPG